MAPTPEEAVAAGLDGAEPEAEPDAEPGSGAAPKGMLPEPDFKLKGPDLAAPTSGPAGAGTGPKLIDLDLKKE